MRRKLKPIDKEQVKKLAERQWSIEQIAAFFDCSRDTIERRFAEIIKTSKHSGAAKFVDALVARSLGGRINMPDGTLRYLQSSDRLLVHALDRFIGPVPRKIEITKEQAIEFLEKELERTGTDSPTSPKSEEPK